MRLELHKVKVKDVQWGSATCVKDGVLYVNKEEAKALIAEENRFARVDLELARPGESTRIIPVKDVVEPRVKLDRKGYYPGFNNTAMGRCGEGKTLVLDGAAVVTCGPIVAFQEGFIDMSGPGAVYTPFSATQNVVLVVEPIKDLEQHQYEQVLREAGLKLGVYLADKCRDAKPDVVDVFEKGTVPEEKEKHPNLPKVIYVCMNITQGLLHDTYVYGADIRPSLPTLLHPNEVLDGAMVSGNCVSACDKNSTYSHQNNPIIADMLKRHGRDFNFVTCIVTNENVTLADKRRSSTYATKLAAMLGLDGVVISEEGFGNPDADLVMNCWKAERLGIKTTLMTDEYAGQDGASQSLADSCPEGDACVTAGNANEVIVLPPMQKVIGYAEEANVIAGGWQGSLAEDGTITVELQAITGATSELGYTKLGAYTL